MSELIIHNTPQTKNPAYIANRKMVPKGILIHSTGANNKKLSRYVEHVPLLGVNPYGNHWNKPTADKCMHAFIGLDAVGRIAVAHTLPYNVVSWGCGKGVNGSYNRDPTGHIQFEVCEDNNKDPVYYKEAFDVTLKYCVYLCKMFGFTADKIVSHQEAAARGYASFHYDPDTWMRRQGDSMNAFRARLHTALEQGGEIVVSEPSVQTGLMRGMRGDAVAKLQTYLRDLGYDIGKNTQVDGIFGAKTEEAVRYFQRDRKLPITGIWTKVEEDYDSGSPPIVIPEPTKPSMQQIMAQYNKVKQELDALGKLLQQ